MLGSAVQKGARNRAIGIEQALIVSLERWLSEAGHGVDRRSVERQGIEVPWGLHLSDAQCITLPALQVRKRSDRIWDAKCLSPQNGPLR